VLANQDNKKETKKKLKENYSKKNIKMLCLVLSTCMYVFNPSLKVLSPLVYSIIKLAL